ncbi:MAG: preprotein translocase subunit SecG [Patescibacteria group bacterium]|nr:preprotein translocase subunit SecG [Patescibacteria group bacterium]
MILTLIQIIISVALISLILLQAKGTGLGSAFGGQSQTYHSKRGVEKVVFYSTIAAGIIFVIISILNFRL